MVLVLWSIAVVVAFSVVLDAVVAGGGGVAVVSVGAAVIGAGVMTLDSAFLVGAMAKKASASCGVVTLR